MTSARAERAVAVGAVLGVTATLFWPIVAGLATGEPRFFEWDVPEQYWPDLVYACEALHEGELPLWNPYDRGGYPFYADPQSAAYHPQTWLVCALGGARPGLGWATLRVLTGFVLAGLFGLLWLRRLGASSSGAVAGAALIQAAPFMRHNWELNLTAALAYLPLVLWAADRLALERRVRDGVVLALSLALLGWIGSPPALWLSSTLALLYLAFRLGEETRLTRGALRDAMPALFVAALLTMGLLGVVVVPAAELAAHSVQTGHSFESIAEEGLAPARLAGLVWPQPGNHLYVGLLALGFALLALARRERLVIFFWGVSIVAVLLAMGAHGPLFRIAFDHVPGVSAFRLPHRYEAWLGPAFGALLALGVTELERRVRSRWMRASWIGSAWTGLALAMLLVLDVTRALPAERHTRRGRPPGQDALARSVLAHAPDTAEHFRMMDEFAISCRAGTRHRRRDLRGYQDPLSLASYERVMASLRDHPELAPQLNVRFVLAGPHFLHGWNRHYLPPPEVLRARLHTRVRHRDGELEVIELLDALPLAYFVPEREVERAHDRGAALARVAELAPSAVAVLEERGSSGRQGRARARVRPRATGREVHLARDELSFVIDAPEAGLLVVNEAYHPGWEATVDGAAAPLMRANGFVRAVRVRPGRHAVSMAFRPTGAWLWRGAWLASIVLAGAILLASRSRRRPGTPQDTSLPGKRAASKRASPAVR